MSAAPVIPLTPIYRRYRDTKALRTDAERLDAAKALVATPEVVAQEFAESVALMDKRYLNTAPFRPKPMHPRPPVKLNHIREDHDLSWFLERQKTLAVSDEPELSCTYANYQLSIISTRGRAVFDDEAKTPAGRALLLDLLLVAQDATPIACEAKLFRDEPFSGLLQLLAYLAHLATTSQYARLAKYHPSAKFPNLAAPRLDGYLLLYEFAEDATYLPRLLDCARDLSASLMTMPAVTAHVRQLVCLDCSLAITDETQPGVLTATTRWRVDGARPTCALHTRVRPLSTEWGV